LGIIVREHIFTLKQSLEAYRYYQQLIAACDQEVQQRIESFETKDGGPASTGDATDSADSPAAKFDLRAHFERIFGVDLTAIPGFDILRVQTIFSELGADLSDFPTPGSFASWLNLCPKDGTSAGRRIRGPKVKSKNRVTQVFRMAGQSLHNNKSFLGDYYRGQRARHGGLKAVKNAGHKLSRIVYHVVTTRQPYDETVFAKLEARHQGRQLRKLKTLAKQMGYSLVATPA
jgi:transposase